jgi:hypothetical protein
MGVYNSEEEMIRVKKQRTTQFVYKGLQDKAPHILNLESGRGRVGQKFLCLQ